MIIYVILEISDPRKIVSLYIEKKILSLMINQLFFTIHNLDILDLPVCKHSFNILKNDDRGISIVNVADYLKKNTDSLRNAAYNDLF